VSASASWIRKPRAPQHDDQAAQPAAMAPVAGGAHDRDDLLDGRRVGRIAASLVAGRTAGMEPRHRGRRPKTPSSIEQHFAHDSSSEANETLL
jgi:hypothetical protein